MHFLCEMAFLIDNTTINSIIARKQTICNILTRLIHSNQLIDHFLPPNCCVFIYQSCRCYNIQFVSDKQAIKKSWRIEKLAENVTIGYAESQRLIIAMKQEEICN